MEKIQDLDVDDELINNLWNISLASYSAAIKKKMMDNLSVNYKNLLSYFTNYKVEIREKPKLPVISKTEIKKPEIKKDNNLINSMISKPKEELPPVHPSTEIIQKKDNRRSLYVAQKMGFKLDLSKEENIEAIQKKLMNLFTTTQKGEEVKVDKTKFKNFVDMVSTLEYKGYDYELSEDDYFRRKDGTIVKTILENEDAAIKKCEEIVSSLKEGEDFFDPDFGSNPKDQDKHRFSIYMNGVAPKGALDPKMIEWYKMEKIGDNPVFLDENADCNDVIQGSIGDCWFISALSVIATKPHLLRGEFNESILADGEIDDEEGIMLSTGIFPPIFHGFRQRKIFCFKFFKNFQWRYVIVDDRLPCSKIYNDKQIPKLLYGKCRNENEFWVPLIEKAYAKLHGSYESLVSGFIDDGLVDLTGLVARKIAINDEIKNQDQVESFWNLVKTSAAKDFEQGVIKDKKGNILKSLRLTKNNTMLGCSVDAKVVESEVVFRGHKTGLYASHAYSILDVLEIPKPNGIKPRKTSRLLRVRNPWGCKEWVGKWNDESEELQQNKER
jgi:hypothetical protein